MNRGETVLSALCITGGLSLIGWNLYDLGIEHGRLMNRPHICSPIRTINRMDWYSPTELRRIALFREQEEKNRGKSKSN